MRTRPFPPGTAHALYWIALKRRGRVTMSDVASSEQAAELHHAKGHDLAVVSGLAFEPSRAIRGGHGDPRSYARLEKESDLAERRAMSASRSRFLHDRFPPEDESLALVRSDCSRTPPRPPLDTGFHHRADLPSSQSSVLCSGRPRKRLVRSVRWKRWRARRDSNS